MPRRPRLSYLRAFDASARHLSFSLAAEELNLTQAAISQQIKKLEMALGVALFIRNNRSLSLNDFGRAYYQVVSEVLDRLDTVTDQLFPDSGKSIVTLYCTPSIATIWLAPRLQEFHVMHPDIEVHLRTTDILPNKYHGSGADLEIVRLTKENSVDGSDHKLWDMRIFPVCSPEFLRTQGPIESADELCASNLIHIVGYRNDWHRWAQRYASPSEHVNSGFSVDGLVIALEAACRGEGIILGRSPLIDSYLNTGELVEAMPGNIGLTSTYILKFGERTRRNQSARVFADWILLKAQY